MAQPKVSILMLTYNAPKYVFNSILSLRKTQTDIPYELIVLDNHSNQTTRQLLRVLHKLGWIDQLYLNSQNDLFARGNNLASQLASPDTTHYLLLNSDIKVTDPKWLDRLIQECSPQTAVVSYAAVKNAPVRADGYCFLIRKELYDRYQLDEDFAWWWSITKLQSQLLKEGWKITAFDQHDSQLIHYGGASTKGAVQAKGMDIDIKEVIQWFDTCQDQVCVVPFEESLEKK